MSREIMAECLEEATELVWASVQAHTKQVIQGVPSEVVATIAVALYQERMRPQTPSPTYGYPVLQVTPAVELEPPSYPSVTSTWEQSGAGNKGGTYDAGTGRRVG